MISIAFSWRYCVVGLYRDRKLPLWHLYPLPFCRLTIDLRPVVR